MREGEMCVPHGIKGFIRAGIQPANPTEPCDGSLVSVPLVGLRKEDPKMKNIKNPNCPSWIRTNNCRNQSPVPYLLAIEHKTLMQRVQTKFCLKSVLIHQCSLRMQTW